MRTLRNENHDNTLRTIENIFEKNGNIKDVDEILNIYLDPANNIGSVRLLIERKLLRKVLADDDLTIVVCERLLVLFENKLNCENCQKDDLIFVYNFLEMAKKFKHLQENRTIAEKVSEAIMKTNNNGIIMFDKITIKILHLLTFSFVCDLRKSSILEDLKKVLGTFSDYDTNCLSGMILLQNKYFNCEQNLSLIIDLIQESNFETYLWSSAFSIDPIRNYILEHNNLLENCFNHLIQLANDSNLDVQTSLIVARSVVFILKKLLENRPLLEHCTSKNLCLVGLMNFALSTIENYFITVKHLSVDILAHSIRLINDCSDKKQILNQVFAIVQSHNKFQSIKYLTLMNIYTSLGNDDLKPILNANLNEFISEIVYKMETIPQTLNSAIRHFLLAALCYDFKERSESDWISYWVHVFKQLLKMCQFLIAEQLIARATFLCNTFVNHVSDLASRAKDDYLFLILLKCCTSGSQLKHEVLPTLLFESIIQQKFSIKLIALKLIVLKQKKSESYTELDLCFILEFFKFNSNIQFFRNYDDVLSVMKNFFDCFQISYHAIKRDNRKIDLIVYESFLKAFYRICIDHLRLGEELTKIKLNLEMLKNLVLFSHIIDSEISIIYQKLVNYSYECVKKSITEIMISLVQEEKIKFDFEFNLDCLSSKFESTKIDDVLTGAYQLYFYVRCTKISKSDILSSLVTKLNDKVKSSTENAQFYGFLFSIRFIMEKENYYDVYYYESLMCICEKIHEKIESHVYSQTPENASLILDQVDSMTVEPIAQLVLLNSWRSIKEIVLIFAFIFERLHRTGSMKQVDQLENFDFVEQRLICAACLLKKLLQKAKHRAIFEQASQGFCRVCCILWKCPSPALNQLPKKWLIDELNVFRNSPIDGSFTPTRRSAGYPYFFKAILAGEKNSGHNNMFVQCVSELLEMARNPMTTYFDKINAMNVLKLIFHDRNFNQNISAFIEEAFILCVTISKETEQELVKNSANSLFSSVLVRIFGLNKKKLISDYDIYEASDCETMGKLSSDLVFTKYPKLFPFIERELKTYGSKPAIFSALMIAVFLSHLNQTTYDDRSYQLHTLIEYFMDIKCYAIHHTTSKVIAKLSQLSQANHILENTIFSSKSCNDNLTLNLHYHVIKNMVKFKNIDGYNKGFFFHNLKTIQYQNCFNQDCFFDTLLSLSEVDEELYGNIDLKHLSENSTKKKAAILKLKCLRDFSFRNCSREDFEKCYLDILIAVFLAKDSEFASSHNYAFHDYLKSICTGIDDLYVKEILSIYKNLSFHENFRKSQSTIRDNFLDHFEQNDVSVILKKMLLLLLQYKNLDLTKIRNELIKIFERNFEQYGCLITLVFTKLFELQLPIDNVLLVRLLYAATLSSNDNLRILAAFLITNKKLKPIFQSLVKKCQLAPLLLIVIFLLHDENVNIRNITTNVIDNFDINFESKFSTILPAMAFELICKYVYSVCGSSVFRFLLNQLKMAQNQSDLVRDNSQIYNPATSNNFIEFSVLIAFLKPYCT